MQIWASQCFKNVGVRGDNRYKMMAENCCLLYHYNAFLVNLRRIGSSHGVMISQPWYHIIKHIIPVICTVWTSFAMLCCHKWRGIHDVFLDPAIISVTLRKPSLGINSDTTYCFTFTCNSLRSNDMWQWHVTSIGIPFEIWRFFPAIFLSLHGIFVHYFVYTSGHGDLISLIPHGA